MNIISSLKKVRKSLEWYSPWRKYFFPRYRYMFSPVQICFMATELGKRAKMDGNILEIGVSGGATTILLAKYAEESGFNGKYYGIDTFSGFTNDDIEYEVTKRGKKSRNYFMTGFEVNAKKYYDWVIRHNKLKQVHAIQADASTIDYAALAPISFALLDVDLYKPTATILPLIYQNLIPGGVIIVDDCDPSKDRWDGAYHAYIEFIEENGLDNNIIHNKLGVIEKRQ